jgi:hypothetical protein
MLLIPIFMGHWLFTQIGKDILFLRKRESRKGSVL